MKKLVHMVVEMKHLIFKHKVYFLAPVLFSLALLAFLFVKLGAELFMAFIYAGI